MVEKRDEKSCRLVVGTWLAGPVSIRIQRDQRFDEMSLKILFLLTAR